MTNARRARRCSVLVALLGLLALPVLAAVPAAAATPAYRLMVSVHTDRSKAIPLAGATVSAPVAIFLTPTTGVREAHFFLDNVGEQIERTAPFDAAATRPEGTANTIDPRPLDGLAHSRVEITLSTGRVIEVGATYLVAESFPGPVRAQVRPGSATLRWAPVDGAVRYALESPEQRVDVSGTTATVALRTDDAGQPLPTENVYLYAINAFGDIFRVYLVAVDLAIPVHPERMAVSVTGPDRSDPRPADGAVLVGDAFLAAALAPGTNAASVTFALVQPRVEIDAPYDLAGTAADGTPRALDTRTLPDGYYPVQVRAVDRSGATVSRVLVQVHVDNGEVRAPLF